MENGFFILFIFNKFFLDNPWIDLIDNQTLSIVYEFLKFGSGLCVFLPRTNLQAEISLDLLFSEMA